GHEAPTREVGASFWASLRDLEPHPSHELTVLGFDVDHPRSGRLSGQAFSGDARAQTHDAGVEGLHDDLGWDPNLLAVLAPDVNQPIAPPPGDHDVGHRVQ